MRTNGQGPFLLLIVGLILLSGPGAQGQDATGGTPFRDPKPLSAPWNPRTDPIRWKEMSDGSTPMDPAFVEQAAKAWVYGLTEESQGEVDDATRRRDQIVRNINSVSIKNPQARKAFVEAYKRAVIQYARDLLDNNLVTRSHAILLVTELCKPDDTIANTEAFQYFHDVLKDSGQPQAMRYLALEGIIRLKLNNLETQEIHITVNQEAVASRAATALLAESGLNPPTTKSALKLLGLLRRAYTQSELKAEVGTAIAKVALDGRQPLDVRLEAAVALASLDSSRSRGWDFETQAVVIARVLWDLADFLALRGQVDERSRYLAVQLWQQLYRNTAKDQKGESNAVLKSLLPIAEAVVASIQAKQLPDPKPLENWLASQIKPNMRMGSEAEPLTIPKPGEAPEVAEK